VIRFWNNEVIENTEGVLERIYLVILKITGKEK
jgi:very-short-patch-repair endonuclease